MIFLITLKHCCLHVNRGKANWKVETKVLLLNYWSLALFTGAEYWHCGWREEIAWVKINWFSVAVKEWHSSQQQQKVLSKNRNIGIFYNKVENYKCHCTASHVVCKHMNCDIVREHMCSDCAHIVTLCSERESRVAGSEGTHWPDSNPTQCQSICSAQRNMSPRMCRTTLE